MGSGGIGGNGVEVVVEAVAPGAVVAVSVGSRGVIGG